MHIATPDFSCFAVPSMKPVSRTSDVVRGFGPRLSARPRWRHSGISEPRLRARLDVECGDVTLLEP